VIPWLLACTAAVGDSAPTGELDADPPPAHTALEPVALLRRLSLDLRGILPSQADQDRVQSDADQLAALRENYLDDALFEERLVVLFSEWFHTLIDAFPAGYRDFDLDPAQEYAFERAVGEEPLRLMARVAAQDRPWSEIVTADWTLADPLLADLWPLDRDEGEGWLEARYTDLRPAAGVLSTNGLWWRYTTNGSNKNRGRAAAMTRLLLCEDMLARPVAFEAGLALSDEDGAEEAIRSEPSCQACHAALEPLAAGLFGFWWLGQYSALEMTSYHAEREPMALEVLGVSPEFFGTPVQGLSELGQAVAADPRFYRCAAERAAEALWRRPVTLEDFDRIEAYRQALMARASFQDLVRAITDDDLYRAGVAAPHEPDAPTRRLLGAERLHTVIRDLTGFSWTWDGYEMLRNDTLGHRILAGGVDGESVTQVLGEPGLTWALVVKRVAEAAANHTVEAELLAGDRDLFCCVSLDDEPGDEAFEEELLNLHWRLFGQVPSADRLSADVDLWQTIASDHGTGFAWQGLLSGLLRDPALVTY